MGKRLEVGSISKNNSSVSHLSNHQLLLYYFVCVGTFGSQISKFTPTRKAVA